ncbi:MAG: hypothetical protein ACJAW3_000729 [Lentimonas sp.]|jgi:hypothetical protein
MDDLVLWLETSNKENIATGAFNSNQPDFSSDLYEGAPISAWRYFTPTKTSSINLIATSDDSRPT